MMRPPGPLPVPCDRSRWFSLASLRTRGDAICLAAPFAVPLAAPFAVPLAGEAPAAEGAATGAESAGAGAVGWVRSGEAVGAEAVAAVVAGPPVPSSSRAIGAPMSAFWPSGTRISARVPAW